MTPTLRLNLNFEIVNEEGKKRIEQTEEKKKVVNEDIKTAWQRIFNMKNSQSDMDKLFEVKEAMENGLIGRHPEKIKRAFSKSEALGLYKTLMESKREGILREMVENKPDNYHLVDNLNLFADMLDKLKKETIIALDTETNGLNYFENQTVGMSLTLPNANQHYYIPYGHEEGFQLKREFVLNTLKPYLENPQLGKVLHNARFDIHMLAHDETPIYVKGLVHDTQIAMHILNENESDYKLKNLATKYLKHPSDTFDTLFGKNCVFSTVPLDVALVYAAKDTHVTWELYQFQLKHMQKQPNLLNIYQKVENPLIEVVVEMEKAGFVIDTEYAKKLGVELQQDIQRLEKEIYETLGEINLNSPIQLKQKLESITGQTMESTDKHALKLLKNKFPIVQSLLDYKEKTKLYTTYIDTLPKQIARDGRVHGSFNQMGAKTGRFSSNNPNLQNQPKYARKLFVAPEKMVLLSGDFSQQEPRLLTHFSKEDKLIESYTSGRDLYSTTASEVFGVPIHECLDGSKYRKMMKMGILAVMYGTSPNTLADQLGISKKEAETFISDFYKKYTKVKTFIDDSVKFAQKHGYIEMLGGRKRRLPSINSKDKWEKLRAERQVINSIIQGSAAIQTKMTMIALHQLCQQKNWQMALSVHDEVGVYAPVTITREEVAQFEHVMLNTVKLTVPNKTDLEISLRWGEGYSVDEWFSRS